MWRTCSCSIRRSPWRASSAGLIPGWAKTIVAFCRTETGRTALPAELAGFARGRLAAHKCPREVQILDALPLTSVGKLDRKALRARLAG